MITIMVEGQSLCLVSYETVTLVMHTRVSGHNGVQIL